MSTTSTTATHPARNSFALMLTRLALVGLATLGVWAVVRGLQGSSTFPPSPGLGIPSMLPVNLISLYLVVRLLHAENRRLRDLFRPGPRGVVADIGWGLLWVVVLYLPFVAAVMLAVWALHGAEMFTAFETIFGDFDAALPISASWALVVAILSLITFAPLNAPVEEVIYRGYAQSHLTKRWSAPAAIVVCSLIFGLHHMFYAPTSDGMVVYLAAFTVWGLCSAIIVHVQKRLLPVTVAHFLVNLLMTVPAVVAPALQLAG